MELREQIQRCLDKTKMKPSHLAAKAGVYPSVISRVCRGLQMDVSGRNYQKITEAIRELEANHG